MKNTKIVNKEKNPAIKVLGRKDYLIVIALVLLCIGMMIWFLFGTVEHIETLSGVFGTEGSLYEVHQQYSGVLTSIEVSRGDFVTEGQVVAKVYPTDETQLPDLDYMKENSVEIKSKVSGVVTNEILNTWQFVDISSTIMCIEESKNSYIDYVYCFVDNSLAETMREEFQKNGRIDMEVRIYPEGYSADIYGAIPGTVENGFFTSNSASEIRDSYYRLISEEETGYPIMIHADPSYLEQFGIQIGDECEVQIVVSENHPYDMIFTLE